MKKKESKEEKQQRIAWRKEVISMVQSLRKRPCEGKELRYLEKEAFAANPMYLEPLEFVCDYVESRVDLNDGQGVFLSSNKLNSAAVRALWHVVSVWKPPKELDPARTKPVKPHKHVDQVFDPYGESNTTVTGVDVRDMRNVPLVAAALKLYIAESRDTFFPEASYNAFIRGGKADLAAAIALAMSVGSRESKMLQRVLSMIAGIAKKTGPAAELENRLQTLCSKESGMGPAIIRLPGASPEHFAATEVLRSDVLFTMVSNIDKIFPHEYVSSTVRIPQALHFQPELLHANELHIIMGSDELHFSAGASVIDENRENKHFYRVIEGRLDVFVGDTKVGTLAPGDWFGEMCLLGSTHTRAKVVSQKKSRVGRVSSEVLNVTLGARHDLASKFYSTLAFDLATRLNVALIQSAASLHSARDLSVDEHKVPLLHASRAVPETRPKQDGESAFRFNAETHAVRAFGGFRVPKKASKKPHPGTLYVFQSQVVSLYQKGHSEKKSIIPLSDILSVKARAEGNLVVDITYSVNKKQKQLSHQFPDVTVLDHFNTLVNGLLENSKASNKATAPPVSSWNLMRAVAVHDLQSVPDAKQEYLSFEVGARFTILDRSGDWFYGFRDSEPTRKGLFPVTYVELRPHGATLPNVLEPSDWEAIKDKFVVHELKQGDTIIKAGDPLACGHLWFVQSGELAVTRLLKDQSVERLATTGEGETLGELVFLLGGSSRASVQVASPTARVLQLPKDRLAAIIDADKKFAGRFW